MKTSDRTESLEAQNRESTIVLAKEFNRICTEQNRIGRFVFMSAEESIIGQGVPQARKYADMKREAETFLINQCDSVSPIIIRPGLVYHDMERPWSVPMGIAANIGSTITGGRAPAGTNLRILADVTINEAMRE